MMKKLFVIVLVALIALPAFSQINFGIKAGVTSTTVPTYNISSGTSNIEALKNAAFGFHVGAFVRLAVAGIYLMPEFVFTSTTYDYNVTTVTGTAAQNQKFNKLEIPLLLGFKLGPFRINAGPAASVMINSPGALIDDPNFKDMYRNATFGYQAGLGLDILNTLTIDFRYEGSLKRYQNQIENLAGTTFNLDDRANAFLFSVGLMF
jgi:opacity protein-like surface antigen